MGYKEIDFGVDNFQKPKVLNMRDSVAQLILNIFTMRPGNMPSLPHIGINIREYLYKTEQEMDVEKLKSDIYNQCSELMSFLSIGDIKIFLAPHEGQDILVIILPLVGLGNDDDALLLGFTEDTTGNLFFNYQFTQGQPNI